MRAELHPGAATFIRRCASDGVRLWRDGQDLVLDVQRVEDLTQLEKQRKVRPSFAGGITTVRSIE
jgi:hypothetical protein